jgi:hypothetical protein
MGASAALKTEWLTKGNAKNDARRLMGFDVRHLFAIDAAHNEVLSAFKDRNVSRIAMFGYSHGGGSTYALSQRLEQDRQTDADFANVFSAIAFTGYIDAITVQHESGFHAERHVPRLSQFHFNYYQDGAPSGDSIEVNPDNVPLDEQWVEEWVEGGLEHTNNNGRGIAENTQVQADLIAKLNAKLGNI